MGSSSPIFGGEHKTMFETTTQKVHEIQKVQNFGVIASWLLENLQVVFCPRAKSKDFCSTFLSPTQHMGSDFRIISVTGMGIVYWEHNL